MGIQVRQVSPADHPVVEALLHEAFGDEPVAPLVTALRRCSGYVPEFELVAEDDGEVVGHVMLTWNSLLIDSGGRRPILVIAPLAVRPDRWRRGIGRTLIDHVVRLAGAAGEPFAVLEGDPAYYGRLGFVAASAYGVRAPSPTVPEPACQLYPITDSGPAIAGRVMYDEAFWAHGGSGLPEATDPDGGYPLPYLFHFAQLNGWIEAVTYGADLDIPVTACPGWTLRDLLAHLEWAYRAASCWDRTGAAPVPAGERATDGGTSPRDPLPGFAAAWRETHATLLARPPATASRGWTSVDRTVGAWRRRMVHEVAVHAADVLESLPSPRFPWRIDDVLALDGIDHTLGVFAARLTGDTPAGGTPADCESRALTVRLTTGNRPVTVTLDGQRLTVTGDVAVVPGRVRDAVPDALIEAEPADLYLWLWGRTPAGAVRVDGDQRTVERFLEATRYARS